MDSDIWIVMFLCLEAKIAFACVYHAAVLLTHKLVATDDLLLCNCFKKPSNDLRLLDTYM